MNSSQFLDKKKIKIGCGGWNGFRTGLKGYSSYYNFVEVNCTYYALPPIAAALSWKDQVPPNFEFSLKAPQKDPCSYEFIRLIEHLESEYIIVQEGNRNYMQALDTFAEIGLQPVLAPRGRVGLRDSVGKALVSADPLLYPIPGNLTSRYFRIFGVRVGILHHLGSEMRKDLTKQLVNVAKKTESMRVVVHTFSSFEDALWFNSLLAPLI